MLKRWLVGLVVALIGCPCAHSQWLDINNVTVKQYPTELGGPKTVIEYDLADRGISPARPVYVFIRCSIDFGDTWQLISMDSLRGSGVGMVDKPGHKQAVWWGTSQTRFADLSQVEIRVRGIAMARVPAGTFILKSLPGSGRDESGKPKPGADLPQFYMAKHETTISMYTDYLNEVGDEGFGWHKRMNNPDRCGIVRQNDNTYSVMPGRAHYPITYISWYDAQNFLQWCGLRLPIEAEWEKALRGGLFLDGDTTKQTPNPLPERRHPWGNDAPDAGGMFRCNFDGTDDGYDYTAPVGTFAKDTSPYGICDLAGNVAEWTLDWYTTSHHAGLDGFRVARGGSWMAVPAACDAITQATQLPLKESSIMGFRGVAGPVSGN